MLFLPTTKHKLANAKINVRILIFLNSCVSKQTKCKQVLISFILQKLEYIEDLLKHLILLGNICKDKKLLDVLFLRLHFWWRRGKRMSENERCMRIKRLKPTWIYFYYKVNELNRIASKQQNKMTLNKHINGLDCKTQYLEMEINVFIYFWESITFNPRKPCLKLLPMQFKEWYL